MKKIGTIYFWLFALAFICFCIGSVLGQTPVATTSEVAASDLGFLQVMLTDLIIGMARSHPWITTTLFLMGAARPFFKPASSLVHNYVLESESKKDDEVLARVEASMAFKAFVYLVDLLLSIKIVKP